MKRSLSLYDHFGGLCSPVAMAYEVIKHNGLIGVLIARAAYNGSAQLYRQCRPLLQNMQLTVRSVGKNMEFLPPQNLERDAVEVLEKMKINHEHWQHAIVWLMVERVVKHLFRQHCNNNNDNDNNNNTTNNNNDNNIKHKT